jgi:hypothetical protein
LIKKYALLCLFGLVFLTILLWSEVGLRSLLAQDEVWIMRSHMITGSQRVLAPAEWPTRPLRWIPHYTAHHLYTDSYLGYNFYLVALFILRGVGVFIVIRKLLRGNQFIPFATSLIYLVYPIGEGWFSFRALTIQTATVLGIYAVYFLLVYWQRPRLWLWILISGLQLASLLTYEQYYGVFALVPLLLLWLQGNVTLSKPFVRVSLLWYLTYVPAAVRYLWIVRNGGTNDYMEERIDLLGESSKLSVIWDNLLEMYWLHVDGWSQISLESNQLLAAVGAGLVAFFVGWIIYGKPDLGLHSKKRLAILLIGAVAFMGISFAHYSFFAHIVSNDFRIYFVPPLGASLLMATIIYFMPQSRWLASGLLAIFVAMGFIDAREQLQAEKLAAQDVNKLLAGVVETLPNLDQQRATVTLVFMDEDDYFSQYGTAIREANLNFALQYIYEEDGDFSIYTCQQARNRRSCEFGDNQIVVRSRDETTLVDYDGVVLFRALPDGEIEVLRQIPPEYGANPLYDVNASLRDGELPPRRAYSFFPCWPIDGCIP